MLISFLQPTNMSNMVLYHDTNQTKRSGCVYLHYIWRNDALGYFDCIVYMKGMFGKPDFFPRCLEWVPVVTYMSTVPVHCLI